MQRWFLIWRSVNVIHHINRLKMKIIWSYHWIQKKHFKNQHSVMINTLSKLGIDGIFLNLIKSTYKISISNIMLNTEWLYAFPVCIMTVCPLFGDNVVLEIAPTVMSEKKRNKSHTDWKEKIKFSLFDNSMIVCIKKKNS